MTRHQARVLILVLVAKRIPFRLVRSDARSDALFTISFDDRYLVDVATAIGAGI